MTEERALRKVRVGMVVSDKMDKTVVVAIEDNVKHAVNQLENPHRIADVKKDIARVMTILHEKNA